MPTTAAALALILVAEIVRHNGTCSVQCHLLHPLNQWLKGCCCLIPATTTIWLPGHGLVRNGGNNTLTPCPPGNSLAVCWRSWPGCQRSSSNVPWLQLRRWGSRQGRCIGSLAQRLRCVHRRFNRLDRGESLMSLKWNLKWLSQSWEDKNYSVRFKTCQNKFCNGLIAELAQLTQSTTWRTKPKKTESDYFFLNVWQSLDPGSNHEENLW